MTRTSNNSTAPRRSATGRYLAAAAAALATNTALLILLSSNSAHEPDLVQPALQAFPLQVLDMHAALSDPVTHESQEPPRDTEPPAELPLPELAAEVPDISEPVRLELATDAPSHIALDTREITIPEAFEPQIPAVRPAAPPKLVPKPVAPKPAGDTRRAVRIDPPNLSDYYPRLALRRGITGVTTIKLVIDKTGQVENIAILSSTPAGVFENAARRHAQASRFQPAVQNGKSVSSVVRYRIKWELPVRSRR
jgi:periplasmic protein TonB